MTTKTNHHFSFEWHQHRYAIAYNIAHPFQEES